MRALNTIELALNGSGKMGRLFASIMLPMDYLLVKMLELPKL